MMEAPETQEHFILSRWRVREKDALSPIQILNLAICRRLPFFVPFMVILSDCD